MGKHGAEYARVDRDLYPTPSWAVEALAEHVDLRGLTVWEPARGNGGMAAALRRQGCARVYTSDIVERGAGQDEVLDFVAQRPKLDRPPDLICTNPPFGQGGRLATAFIDAGLKRLGPGGLLALLLPCDFDSAKTRARYFGNCPHFAAKIVLRERVVWFKRTDGIREAPKENSAWFLWQRSPLRARQPPVILYAPANAATELPYDEARQADEDERTLERIEAQMHERYQEGLDDYDANADFAGSIDDCYAAVRARVAAGGKGWQPP